MKFSSFDETPTDPKPSASSFAGMVHSSRTHVDVTVPRTTIAGKMRILSRHECAMVRYEARAFLLGRGLTEPLNTYREWHEELAVRTLAVAVRNPANIGDTLATLEAWSQCDDGQIDALWQRYQDLQDEIDPLGNAKLSEREMLEMQAAAKKKDGDLLRSYGSSRLAAFAITLAEPPST